jgi:hypothetical protein
MRNVFCLMLAVFLGCDEKPNSVADNNVAKPWVTFQHPSVPFSILLPEQPQTKSGANSGHTRTVHIAMYGKSASIACAAIPNDEVIDISDVSEKQEMLRELLRVNHPTSKILDERSFVFQGKYPAHDATMEINIPKAGLAKQRLRMVLLPKETIMILVVGKPQEVDSEEITKSLNSLRIRN